MSLPSADPARAGRLTAGAIVRRVELLDAITDLEMLVEWLDAGNGLSRERLVSDLRSSCRALRATMRRPESEK